jgi:hypothetical protein
MDTLSAVHTTDTFIKGHHVQLHFLSNGRWRYEIAGRIESDKVYRSAGDAESDATDLLIAP